MTTTKKHGFRYCKVCSKKLVCNGSENGKQRWRCLRCGAARIAKRNNVAGRNRLKTYTAHLLSKGTANDIARTKGISRRTFDRRHTTQLTSALSTTTLCPKAPTVPMKYVVIDATSLSDGVVAIARTETGQLHWRYAAWESSVVWVRNVRKEDHTALFVGTFHGLQEAYEPFLRERN